MLSLGTLDMDMVDMVDMVSPPLGMVLDIASILMFHSPIGPHKDLGPTDHILVK